MKYATIRQEIQYLKGKLMRYTLMAKYLTPEYNNVMLKRIETRRKEIEQEIINLKAKRN